MVDAPDNWRRWYDRHAAAMLLLARQRVPGWADAEDVVQDAFVRFWPRHHQVADARAYLYRCVRCAAADFLRGRHRRRARERTVALDPGATGAPLFGCDPEADERRLRVETALAGLPAEQREVVVLRIWADLTFAQIADVLDASANTVASRYRYALNALRGVLAEEVIT